MRRRKFWGWGWEDGGPDQEQQERLAQLIAFRFGLENLEIGTAPQLEDLNLRPPRCTIPERLTEIISTDPHERAGHSYGKSFRDVVRGFDGDYPNPIDFVALPRTEEDLARLLDWCATARVAAIPYGGGSSVVGGVEPPLDGRHRAAVSIDLRHFDRVLEVDDCSRAARIQAGIYGPALEDQLRESGLTLRHFPQSFEFSTLGGWIATRSGGHFASLYTHIDDFVESLRLITPTGPIETRRLPGSGAGPSPDRFFIGSEGTLGIITEAWMRLQKRPLYRNGVSVTFADFNDACDAVRQISQAGLYPSNCRLLDAGEALLTGAGTGDTHVLILAFESADHSLDAWMERALECCRDHYGQVPEGAGETRRDTEATHEGAAGAWRSAFLSAPYLRDVFVSLGLISETFETAVTWDRFPAFHAAVLQAVNDTLERVCGGGQVTCRFTHIYPDGPAPYYTVLAPSRRGSQLAQWTEIKSAASATILEQGGTITHHHAVGRDHRIWYEQQCPEGFARAFAAAKGVLDPQWILNPGILIKEPEMARSLTERKA